MAREEGGYRLAEQGFAALQGRRLAPAARSTLPLVHALLPAHVGAEQVAARLARRWFRGLRWYGIAEAPGETTLTWLAEPGGEAVRVRIAGGAVVLEVEMPPGREAKRFPAAKVVLAALAELYGLAPEEGGAAGALPAWLGVAA